MILKLWERLCRASADTTSAFIVTYAITLLSDVSRRIPELPYGSQGFSARGAQKGMADGAAWLNSALADLKIGQDSTHSMGVSMAEPLELKKTLNLPRTDFPMKANLPQNEPKQLAAWDTDKIYWRILESRKGLPLFVLHDGPPYPTGTIHLGTGLNKILKDLIVKSKSMAGHYAPYIPGWDCHGLPIETQVEKELGGKGKVPPAEFRKLCREFAARYVEQHRRDFKRLGVFGQWEAPYLTMDFGYEATIASAFLDFMEKGYVYR